jgi:hypothetical protein
MEFYQPFPIMFPIVSFATLLQETQGVKGFFRYMQGEYMLAAFRGEIVALWP